MKKRNLLFMIMIFCLNLNGQNLRLKTLIGNDGWNLLVVMTGNNITDTLNKSSFEFKILDTLINDSIIEYIYESPVHISYNKYFKTDTGWVWSWTSGMLSSNPNQIRSVASKYDIGPQKITAKIIADDKVYLKIGNNESIIDCNDFKLERETKRREYQEWLLQEEKKKIKIE